MRIIDLTDLPGRRVDAHGSTGFTVAPLGASADAHLVAVQLAPGGVIGRHPAEGVQVLIAITGEATVTGDSAEPYPLRAGQAAVWEPWESHTTETEDGFTGFIIEGEVDLDTRPGAVDAP